MAVSEAADAVMAADHPSPDQGGPCATCAFRPGTEAYGTARTRELAALCVEGLRPFYCHESPQLCRGFIAAANLRGVPESDEDRRWAEVCRLGADLLAACVDHAAKEDRDAGE
ncbi:MAG TPA: hypothetical protein VN513_06220 [Gemmatimonadales bacterium]|nr:hypothetical protein [Gemmatimonadales bacterium]